MSQPKPCPLCGSIAEMADVVCITCNSMPKTLRDRIGQRMAEAREIMRRAVEDTFRWRAGYRRIEIRGIVDESNALQIINEIDGTPSGITILAVVDSSNGDTASCLKIRDALNRARSRLAFSIIYVEHAIGAAALITLAMATRFGFSDGTIGDFSCVTLSPQALSELGDKAVEWRVDAPENPLSDDLISWFLLGNVFKMQDAIEAGIVDRSFDNLVSVEEFLVPTLQIQRELLGFA